MRTLTLTIAGLLLAGSAQAQYLRAPEPNIVDNSIDAPVPMQRQMQSMQPAPIMQQQTASNSMRATGQFEVVSGGITGDERAELDASQRGKSTKLVFAATNGEYLADVNVAIRDAKGNEVSNFTTEGPYVFIDLPRGSYTMTATLGGESKTQKLTVGSSQKAVMTRFRPQ